MREELDSCAAAAPCDSLRLRSGSQEATGWVATAGKHATLLNVCNGSARKTNDWSRFRLALSHLPNPEKCKHAEILSHVIVKLGSEMSFATLKKIKIPFSLKSKIGVFQSILNHSPVFLFRWTEDSYVE